MSAPESSTRSKAAKWIGIAYVALVSIAMLDGFRSFIGALFLYGFLATIAWAITLFATRGSKTDGSHPSPAPADWDTQAAREAIGQAVPATPRLEPQPIPGTARSRDPMTAGAVASPPLSDSEREARRTTFEGLPAEMRSMMMARS